MVNIFIVDDHNIVREGIRMVLELEETFTVCGEAENGEQAIQMLANITPDIILLDLNMPVVDGIQFLRKLQAQNRTIPCIVLTTYKDQHLLMEAVSLGVKSYLLKDAGREVIYETIYRVLRGERWFPSEIEKALEEAERKRSLGLTLTAKEMEIVRYLAQGLTNSEIADKFFVSERTIKSYLTVIYEKLQVKSRAQAIAVANEKNYFILPERT